MTESSTDALVDRPIFVVGFQRSGTTLLQSLLGAHPRIASPPEMYFVFRVGRFVDHYGDLSDDANLRQAIHDALNPPQDLLADCGFDEDKVFARARDGERTMRGVLDAIMRDFAERQGKARWSEKSPGQSVAQVHSIFPDAQIVHIVRDPRDVIASSLRTPWTRSNAHDLAHAWRRFTLENFRRGLKSGPSRFLQIRYEDLTREPETVLALVFTFLGETYDQAVLTDVERRRATIADVAAPWQRRALEAVTPATEGTWRKKLSRRDRLIVHAVLHKELTMLGYAPPSRRDVIAGAAIDMPFTARDSVRRWKAKRSLRDPAAQRRAIQAFIAEQARIMEGQSEKPAAIDPGIK